MLAVCWHQLCHVLLILEEVPVCSMGNFEHSDEVKESEPLGMYNWSLMDGLGRLGESLIFLLPGTWNQWFRWTQCSGTYNISSHAPVTCFIVGVCWRKDLLCTFLARYFLEVHSKCTCMWCCSRSTVVSDDHFPWDDRQEGVSDLTTLWCLFLGKDWVVSCLFSSPSILPCYIEVYAVCLCQNLPRYETPCNKDYLYVRQRKINSLIIYLCC